MLSCGLMMRKLWPHICIATLLLQMTTGSEDSPAPNATPSPMSTPSSAITVSYAVEEDDDQIDKAGLVSKACRYDDAEWSDCDPFELVHFRVLRLLSGGRQCEEMKNISRHCTPEDFPPGTRYLISEHRKCIGELKRLKMMIADLAKYISTLHEKGTYILNSYMSLKKHLDELKATLDTLKRENDREKESLAKAHQSIEQWRSKAHNLQAELDDIRSKYHDLQAEHKEMGAKLKQCHADKERTKQDNERLKKQIKNMEGENAELKRRLMDAEKYKEQLREAKYTIGKLEYKAEKLQDHLERVQDDVAQCKLDVLNANHLQETKYNKDTHVDLSMEMWITHNKTMQVYSTESYTYPTTYAPPKYEKHKCLITYYGYTNETCWYDSKASTGDTSYHDSLGPHLVEAHWKYFTIEVKDPYECDRAAKLHYEFLVNRCSPKHYLPVMSIYRPEKKTKELTTHIYPKPNIPQPGDKFRCWVTFLGPQGHCEAHSDEYWMWNTDDTPEGYSQGSGTSKSRCLARRDNWRTYCHTPVIVTYVPEGISTTWNDDNIQHDSHGSHMFEEDTGVKNLINPESINPHFVKRPESRDKVEYEDTPEFRKSLNMKGSEREQLLSQLRARLGMAKSPTETAPGANPNVQWQGAHKEILAGAPATDNAHGQYKPQVPSQFLDKTNAQIHSGQYAGGTVLTHGSSDASMTAKN